MWGFREQFSTAVRAAFSVGHSPDKLICTGSSHLLLSLPLVVLAEDVLWKHFLQLTGGEGTRATAFHAAEL